MPRNVGTGAGPLVFALAVLIALASVGAQSRAADREFVVDLQSANQTSLVAVIQDVAANMMLGAEFENATSATATVVLVGDGEAELRFGSGSVSLWPSIRIRVEGAVVVRTACMDDEEPDHLVLREGALELAGMSIYGCRESSSPGMRPRLFKVGAVDVTTDRAAILVVQHVTLVHHFRLFEVWRNGHLQLMDTTVRDVFNPLQYVGADPAVQGAVVWASFGMVTLERCTIAGVTTALSGGVFYAEYASLMVTDSTFASVTVAGIPGNPDDLGGDTLRGTTQDGGLVACYDAAVHFQRCSATDFDVYGSAAFALVSPYCVVTAEDVVFSHARVEGNGGFALVQTGGHLVVRSSFISDVVPVGRDADRSEGGVVYLSQGQASIENTTILGVRAGKGGVAYVSSLSALSLVNSTLLDIATTDALEGNGGLVAVVAQIPGPVSIVGCLVVGVRAAFGGIVYVTPLVERVAVEITDTVVHDVHATSGGVAFVSLPLAIPDPQPVHLEVFRHYLPPADVPSALVVTRSRFFNVSVDGDGGGVLIEGGRHELNITDSTFEGVHAERTGGLVAHRGLTASVASVATFTPPVAFLTRVHAHGVSAADGGVFFGSMQTTVADSSFVGLSGTVGAALARLVDGCNFQFVSCNVSDARATLFWAEDASTLSISGSSFSSLSAAKGALVRAHGAASVTLSDAHLTSAVATAAGGVLFSSEEASVSVVRCAFSNMSAGAGGVAAAGDTSSVHFVNVSAIDVRVVFGGALSLSDRATMRVEGVKARGLFAQNGAFASLRDGSVLHVVDGDFSNLTASGGGGGLVAGMGRATVRAMRLRLAHVEALSGALAAMDESSSFELSSSTVTDVSGNALAVSGRASAVVDGSTLRDVVSRLSGAIASLAGFGTVALSSSTVSSARTLSSGGAVACTGGSVSLTGCVFDGLGAVESAGFAILDGPCRARLENVSVVGVSVHGDGEGGKGGAFLASSGAVIDARDLLVDTVTAPLVGGGFIAAIGGASVAVENAVLRNVVALDGGALYVGSGSDGTVRNVFVYNSTASGKGGCVHVGANARLMLKGLSLDLCYGSTGGAVYADALAAIRSEGVRINRTNAVLGPGVYLASPFVVLGNVTFLRNPGHMSAAELPPGWVRGGLLTTGVRTLALPAGFFSESSALLPAFSLTTLDALGLPISLPRDAPLTISLAVEGTTGAKIEGDTEKSFGSSPEVTFGALRLNAPPGVYALRVESSNPLLYGEKDTDVGRRAVLSNLTIPVTVLPCGGGRVLELSPISAGDARSVWHCVSPTDDTAKIVPAVVVPCVVGLVALVALLRWQTAAMRRKRSHEAHLRFLEEHWHALRTESGGRPTELDREAVELQEKLGEGEFGVVRKARVTADSRPRLCAAKTLKEGSSFEQRVEFVKEAEIMHSLAPHVNVVGLVGVCTTVEPVLIILELVPHGSALSFVRGIPDRMRKAAPTRVMLERFAQQICSGMEYLAAMHIVHRDLAARNVMVGQDAFGEYIMKVADFGMSKSVSAERNYFRLTQKEKMPVKWMAPEALNERRFTEQSDVWGYGVTLWELFSFGAVPWAGIPIAELRALIRRGDRLAQPPSCSDAMYDVLRQCWAFEAKARPSFAEIREAIGTATTTMLSQEHEMVPTSQEKSLTVRDRTNTYANPTVPSVAASSVTSLYDNFDSTAVDGEKSKLLHAAHVDGEEGGYDNDPPAPSLEVVCTTGDSDRLLADANLYESSA